MRLTTENGRFVAIVAAVVIAVAKPSVKNAYVCYFTLCLKD